MNELAAMNYLKFIHQLTQPPGSRNGIVLSSLRECSGFPGRTRERSPSAKVRASTAQVQRRKWTLVGSKVILVSNTKITSIASWICWNFAGARASLQRRFIASYDGSYVSVEQKNSTTTRTDTIQRRLLDARIKTIVLRLQDPLKPTGLEHFLTRKSSSRWKWLMRRFKFTYKHRIQDVLCFFSLRNISS